MLDPDDIAWKRAWKIELIEKASPEWRDLFEHIT
jgi:predicted GIY-YIG superfamily endonuclease